MRRGMSPLEAGMEALQRIARNYSGDMDKLQFIDMAYYVLRKDGAYAGVSLWTGYSEKPHTIVVHDGTRRSEVTVSLFKGPSHESPPFPVEMPKELTKDSVSEIGRRPNHGKGRTQFREVFPPGLKSKGSMAAAASP